MESLELVLYFGYFGLVDLIDIDCFELRLIALVARLVDRLNWLRLQLRRQALGPSTGPAGLTAGTLLAGVPISGSTLPV